MMVHYIAKHTARGSTLSVVLNFPRKGWPSYVERGNLNPLSLKVCLVYGMDMVVSPKLHPVVIPELHDRHPGIV